MGKKLYFECYSGISGDMVVASLLDLGADEKLLKNTLESLPLTGFKIEIKKIKKSGIEACDFNVILDKEHENHDHDMDYLHGHHHHEEEEHDHNHHHHHHEHRNLNDIIHIINHSNATENAKKIAISIFMELGKAEAKAHGVSLEEVHFHEVGAVDSIVDILAAAICFDNLEIDEVIIPQLYDGYGFVRCQHGMMPVPVPAVANIVKDNNINLQITNIEGELVTPTGAAIVAALKTSDILPKKFSILKLGIGAGKRNYERPSMLRAMLIEDNTKNKDSIYKLESNIDDCSGEILGLVMEKLFAAGARDVHYTPVFMKKNRPAYQINVVCLEENIEKLENIIFEETTTIGIRRLKMERSVLKREIKKISTSLGEAQIKICSGTTCKKIYPEYESVKALATKHNLSYQEVYDTIKREAQK